ncbi:MAG TPA: circadian clock KaiB family protein [Polyangiaceae bacterium]|nr:circadian clock KaiB family protein [Polyangiaceae bacterium]
MSAQPGASSAVLRLCLYVAGDSPNSVAAERNLRGLLASYPGVRAELQIRDVLVDPEGGLAARVLATPTLVKSSPAPEARVMGDLRDLNLLRSVLGLGEVGPGEPGPR